MAGVFISYRREDAPGHAGRVFDRLRTRFGTDTVFMDVTAIDAGVDFVVTIDKAVGNCDVLLAIIGPQWAAAADHGGRKRLENPNDFVRLEVAGALKRDVRVVPLLVDNAQLPGPADLPEDLQPLLRRNAMELRDAHWDADIAQLIASLERVVKSQTEPIMIGHQPPRTRLTAIWALVALAAVAAAVVFYESRGGGSAPPPAKPAQTVDPPNINVAPPKVVGKPLAEAREILRRAGVKVSRVVYHDDRTQAVDLVVGQADVLNVNGGSAVSLTVVARAAIVIRHKPEDGDVARGLLEALMSSPSARGLVVRTVETGELRREVMGHAAYSDDALAATAADVATDATAWLRQHEPERPEVSPARYAPVVTRTIIIGLPARR